MSIPYITIPEYYRDLLKKANLDDGDVVYSAIYALTVDSSELDFYELFDNNLPGKEMSINDVIYYSNKYHQLFIYLADILINSIYGILIAHSELIELESTPSRHHLTLHI